MKIAENPIGYARNCISNPQQELFEPMFTKQNRYIVGHKYKSRESKTDYLHCIKERPICFKYLLSVSEFHSGCHIATVANSFLTLLSFVIVLEMVFCNLLSFNMKTLWVYFNAEVAKVIAKTH